MQLGPESILITSGAQQGLSLLARAFIEPGDVVITEAPTFIGALMTFRWAGAEIVGVPVDDEGIRCDHLEEIFIKHQPKLLYLMPTFQNPTGTVLTKKRRQRVTELSIRYRVPIIESDLYREIFFTDPPPPTLKSLDEAGLVIYQGSFSKFACPGLRIGWLAAAPNAVATLLAAKAYENLHVPALTQQVAARFLQSEHLERHLSDLRAACRARRDQFIENLQRYAPSLKFRIPGGGYYLWAEVARPLSAAELCRAALARDVAVREGTKLMPQGGGDDRIRLTFVSAPPSEIAAGTQRLGEAIQDAVSRVTGGAPARPVARVPIV
jgi:DNA-binding transcriptional MocR family regulator